MDASSASIGGTMVESPDNLPSSSHYTPGTINSRVIYSIIEYSLAEGRAMDISHGTAYSGKLYLGVKQVTIFHNRASRQFHFKRIMRMLAPPKTIV